MEKMSIDLLKKIFVESGHLHTLLFVSKKFNSVVKSTDIYDNLMKAHQFHVKEIIRAVYYISFREIGIKDDMQAETIIRYLEWGLDKGNFKFIKYVFSFAEKVCPQFIIGKHLIIDRLPFKANDSDYWDIIIYCINRGAVDERKLLLDVKEPYQIEYLLSKFKYSQETLNNKLSLVCYDTDDLSIYNLLIKYGAAVSESFHQDIISNGRLEAYKHFVQNSLFFSIKKRLLIAVKGNQVGLLKYMTSGIFYFDEYGQELLENAIENDNQKVLEYLFEKVPNYSLNDLLVLACKCKHIHRDTGIIKFLVQKGADVTYDDNKPIKMAVENLNNTRNIQNDENRVKFLIQKGADVSRLRCRISWKLYDYAVLWATMKFKDYVPTLKSYKILYMT